MPSTTSEQVQRQAEDKRQFTSNLTFPEEAYQARRIPVKVEGILDRAGVLV